MNKWFNRVFLTLYAIVLLQCIVSVCKAEETTIVCQKGKYHNTCLSEGRTVSTRQYVKEHSKYQKIVDTKTTGKYNDRKMEITVKK